MAMVLKQLLIFSLVSILLNIVFVELAKINVIDCPNLLPESYNTTIGNATDSGSVTAKATPILELAMGRCEGFPWYIFWIFHKAILVALPTLIFILASQNVAFGENTDCQNITIDGSKIGETLSNFPV